MNDLTIKIRIEHTVYHASGECGSWTFGPVDTYSFDELWVLLKQAALMAMLEGGKS